MVRDTRFYDILKVSPEASTAEIRKAYRVLALKYHPDKNNHSEDAKSKFLQICEAYEILNDEQKRSLYDQYGAVDEASIEQLRRQDAGTSSFFSSSSPMGMSAGDLFAQFFDNVSGGPFSHKKTSATVSRGPDIRHDLKCTLAELYDGKKTKLGLNRRRICKSCQGHGGTRKKTCKVCKGQGQQTQTRKMGPMVQTWSQTCPECGGTGSFMKHSDICPVCEGEGCTRERKIFDVEVKPGMCHGQVIVLPGEADEVIKTNYGNQTVIPGDVIITINQIRDPKFQRVNKNGSDLVLRNCKIPLATSLCGGSIYIDGHPNGKLLNVTILPGELIKPNDFKSIQEMGMPKYDEDKKEQDSTRGNLYIQFQVEFPKNLTSETITKLKQVLGDDPHVQEQITTEDNKVYKRVDDCIEMEEHVLSSFVPDFNDIMRNETRSSKKGNKKRKYYDDSDLPDTDDHEHNNNNNCTIH